MDPTSPNPNDPSDGPAKPGAGGSAKRDDDLIEQAMQQAAAVVGVAPRTGEGEESGEVSDTGLPPDIFPGYRLVRAIHEGGQGVVYEAIQRSTKRRVAVKVLKHGAFSSNRDRVRFEREKEILAQLNHPNIVAIHDSGSVASTAGVHGTVQFFVMDYIEGVSLKKYVQRSNLGRDATLSLFSKICDAVNAAHLKGVIHRDLKPDNVRIDHAGEPHILDFGLAKAIGLDAESGAADQTMTISGDFVGTPLYAAPEQAARDTSRVDVRTDVHAIGVMLFEALTGRLPYGAFTNWRDALDAIINREPIQARSVSKQVNEEINTIVAKAISKEPERRYQNAGELGRDIRHYLAGEPILAKSESALYVIGKHLKRNRGSTIAGAICLATIIGAGVVSTVFWRHAVRDRDAAMKATAAQESATARAEREAGRLRRMQDLHDAMFAALDPDALRGRDASVLKDVLWQSKLDAERELADDADLLAQHQTTLARSFLAIDARPAAEEAMQKALDARMKVSPDSAGVADVLLLLAELRQQEGKPAAAEDLARRALGVREKVFGADSVEAAEALKYVGIALRRAGRFAEAEQAYLRGIGIVESKRGKDSIEAAELLTSLARVRALQGDRAGSINTLERCLRIVLATRGDGSSQAAIVRGHLATVLRTGGSQEDAERAIVLTKQVLDGYRESFGPLNPLHWRVALAEDRYGLSLAAAGRLVDAESAAREAIASFERGVPVIDSYLNDARLNLAIVLSRLAKYGEADALFAAVAREVARSSTPGDPQSVRLKSEVDAHMARKSGMRPGG